MASSQTQVKRDGKMLGLFLMGYEITFQFGTMVLMIILTIVVQLAGFAQLKSAVTFLTSDCMQLLVGIFFLVLYIVKRKEIKQIEFASVERRIDKWKITLLGLLVVVGINCFVSLLDRLFTYATGLTLQVGGVMDFSSINPIALLLMIGVFPAVVEELLFRGVLYRYLRKHGVAFATITSSLLFGLCHLNFMQLVFATGMGIVLCVVYEKTNRIGYCMIIHFINNSIMVLELAIKNGQSIGTIVENVVGVLFIGVLVLYGKKVVSNCQINKKDLVDFFTSIPMLLFITGCLGMCVISIIM